MRLRFYYYWSGNGEKVYGHEPTLLQSCETDEPRKEEWFSIDAKFSPEEWGEISLARPYATYLGSALNTDFPAHHPELCDEALQDINKLEHGEIDAAEWGGEGFCHSLTPTKATFEHSIFGECPEWPIWSCPLAHYKAALLGWRRFIDMPKSIESEVIVELPEGEPDAVKR